MKTGHWKTRVPIYRTILHVVAQKDSESLIAYRNKMSVFYGADERLTDQPGFISFDEGMLNVGIFISIGDFTPGLLAHEIFHATVRILQRVGHRLDWDHQEPHAYLLEWITDEVYSKLQ